MKLRYAVFALFLGLSLTSVEGAVGDHVYNIELFNGKSLSSDNTEIKYEFSLSVNTDDQVKLLEFLTPAGNTYTIPALSDQWDSSTQTWTSRDYDGDGIWNWEYDQESSDSNFLDSFGDGWFTFTVTYQDDSTEQTNVWFGMADGVSYIPMPQQDPTFISPTNKSSIDSPVTISWQECTDENTLGIHADVENYEEDEYFESFFDKTDTQWQDLELSQGIWSVSLAFYNGETSYTNADGISCFAVKYVSNDRLYFAVDQPWATYEVWGGTTDLRDNPEAYMYFYNINEHGYTKLGESDGSTKTFDGSYPFYVIGSRLIEGEQVRIDAIKTSTGWSNGGNMSHTGNVDEYWNIPGYADSTFATISDNGSYNYFDGFIVLENPGTWHWVKVITDNGCSPADLNGDCIVNIEDLAILASEWLK